MEKLNVCLLNDSFPPAIDGVANTTFNYASIIQQNYGNVTVATPRYPGIVDHYPFEVLRYSSISLPKSFGYRGGLPFDPLFLSKFNERPIDIIHTHCPAVSSWLARMIRTGIHKPVVFTYHTKFDIDVRKSIANKTLAKAALKAIMDNINAADEVWTVSKGAGENLRSLGFQGEYRIMSNGVDFEKGRACEAEIEKTRQKYGIRKGPLTFLFVGRIMWYKGLKIIVDALSQLQKTGVDFQMLFVGNGTDREDLQQYIRQCNLTDRCIFTAAVYDRAVLKAIFSLSDLFLFPSTYDTNGIVVREAAATGLGSVLVEGSCAAEDATGDVNCLLMKENADDLARILIQNGNNRDYFHRIGANAQRDLYMSWRQAVDNAVGRYQEIIESYRYVPQRDDHFNLGHGYLNTCARLGRFVSSVRNGVSTAGELIGSLGDEYAEARLEVKRRHEEKEKRKR